MVKRSGSRISTSRRSRVLQIWRKGTYRKKCPGEEETIWKIRRESIQEKCDYCGKTGHKEFD